MDNYENMNTNELRGLIRKRGIGGGLALSSANKETCVKLLTGELSWEDFKAQAGAGPSFGPQVLSHESTPSGTAGSSDAMQQIAAGLAALMPKQQLDEGKVREIASAAAVGAVESAINTELDRRLAPVRVVVERRETNVEKDLGVVHKRFPLLLQLCQARDKDGYVPPVYLYGPAGTGKTTTARKKDFEVTPRAVDRGLALLKAGVPMSEVIECCVRKGLNRDAWAKVEG